MTLDYTLELQDHLAWYDAYSTLFPATGIASFPLVGAWMRRNRRMRFMRGILSPSNSLGLGPRSIELSDRGVREFNEHFDFTLRWLEYTLVAATEDHLFLAQPNMNARIIPLRFCPTRQELLSFVEKHSKASPPIRRLSIAVPSAQTSLPPKPV